MRHKRDNINADITILASKDGVEIELRCRDSNVRFFTGTMSTAMFSAALGRMGCCEFKQAGVSGLDKVGKVMEMEHIQFEMPERKSHDKDIAMARSIEHCPEGWTPDCSFGSQDSFVHVDGKWCANDTIRRWVDKKEQDK